MILVGDERFIGMDERFLGGGHACESNRCFLDINPSLNFSISIISIEDAYLLAINLFILSKAKILPFTLYFSLLLPLRGE